MADSQENKQKEQNDVSEKKFMIEKIKERPVNKKKLLRRTLITASMAVIFGLVACFTFLVLEPVISNWLYPEEEPQVVVFPEDQDEMSPEQMLAENMQQENQSSQSSPAPSEVMEQEQIRELLSGIILNLDNYKQIYNALSQYVAEMNRSMVTVTGVSSGVDWFNNVNESKNQSSGVIIAQNGKQLLILTDYSPVKQADDIIVTFNEGTQADASLKEKDETTGLAVIAVELDPPFNQDAQKLMEGAFQLKQSGVDIITIADSPLARARADSVLLAAKVSAMVDIPVMPHIACRDRNRISMHSTLLGAHINGIRNLMIVTGDPVPSGERDNTKSVFDFNSIRFMEYVKELNQEIFLQDAFSYGGALNQNQANEDQVMKRMQKKIDAGLSWFMTQPIYSDEEVEKLGRMKQELNTKILCGIMPLVSYRNAMFIKNEMPGIQVPDEIVAQYRPDMSRAEAEDVAVRISLSIMEKLEEVADGFYFMTPFNRVSLITRIIHARKPQ